MRALFHFMLVVLLPCFCRMAEANDWEVWPNARLITDEYMDGDSFNLRKAGGRHTYTIRLYGVDAPETDARFPDRIRDQAGYWGITADEAMKVGGQAARFARSFLDRGFTVHTRKQDAMGAGVRNRYFGFIEAEGADLGLALVSNGLARVYGVYSDLPNGVRWAIYRARLTAAERDAKANGRGAWALRAGAAKTAPARPSEPAVPSGLISIRKALAVYDPSDHRRVMGILQPGGQIEVKGPDARAGLLQIEVVTREGGRVPGLCHQSSLAP